MDGAQVGCLVGDGMQDVDVGDKSSDNFKASLKNLFVVLQTEFINIGVDCNEFQNHGATKARADITLRL
jgi:ubiquitin-conjugating enzyme E2 O